MSRNGSTDCGVCQSTFASGDCIHIDGNGTIDDPFVATPIISDADNNLVQEGPNGLGAFLPPGFVDPPCCHAYGTEPQPIPWEVVQGVILNEERYDTDNMHSTEELGESNRITFNTEGVYYVSFVVQWSKTNDNSATGDLALYIRKNGSEVIAVRSIPVPNGDVFTKMTVCYQGAFMEGERVDALVKQDVINVDGDPMTLFVDVDRFSPVFSAMYLRSLDNMTILGAA